MSAELVILVPVLARPHRVAPLLDSIEASTPRARVYFLSQRFDNAENAAIGREFKKRDSDRLRINQNLQGGTYAEKINRALRHPKVSEPLIFLGADDLEFQPGWFEAATAAMRDGVEVVGVNDLIPRRRPGRKNHATHFLVTREYAERGTVDEAPGLLHEGYDHSFVDDELIATAKQRGVYAYARDAHVRHLHWMARSAPDDETYRKGRAKFEQDRRLFHERKALWA